MVLIWEGLKASFDEYFPLDCSSTCNSTIISIFGPKNYFQESAKKFLRGLAHYQLEWHHWLMKASYSLNSRPQNSYIWKEWQGEIGWVINPARETQTWMGHRASRHMTILSIWKIRCQKAKGAGVEIQRYHFQLTSPTSQPCLARALSVGNMYSYILKAGPYPPFLANYVNFKSAPRLSRWFWVIQQSIHAPRIHDFIKCAFCVFV